MTRAIYDKAIYKRKQQMDRAVYKRARNVLPTGGGSIEPSNQDWYVLSSVEVIDGGEGFTTSDSLWDDFENAGLQGELLPDPSVSEVDSETGAIVSISVDSAAGEAGMVSLSNNNGSLPLIITAVSDDNPDMKEAKLACNWVPYTNSIPEGEYSEGDPYFELYDNCDIWANGGSPVGGLNYEPTDPNYPNEFRFEVPNGLSDKPAGILGGEITDGVITRLYVVNGGFYPTNVFEHYSNSPLIEAVVPGNPGKGCMILLSFDTHVDDGGQ